MSMLEIHSGVIIMPGGDVSWPVSSLYQYEPGSSTSVLNPFHPGLVDRGRTLTNLPVE